MSVNPIDVFTILLSGKKIKESKDAKKLAAAELEYDQWLDKQEYLQDQRESYDATKRKIKIEDEKRKRIDDFNFKMKTKPIESQVEFGVKAREEGLGGLSQDRFGNPLPFDVFSQRVNQARTQKKLRDKLKSEKQSFLQTQNLEQSDLALRTATIQAQNKAEATFAEQGYGNLKTEDMSFNDFAIAVKTAKEKDALAATSAEERQKVIEKYVGMGYGNFLKDENGNDRSYEDFIKLAVEQEQTDILKRKKQQFTQEKEISAKFETKKREAVREESLRELAFKYGINPDDEIAYDGTDIWKDDLQKKLQGMEENLTFEEKSSLNLLNEVNKTNKLNEIASTFEKVKNTDYTLFKDIEGVTPFVMPKKVAGTKTSETDRLRLMDAWGYKNFDNVARATNGLKNSDMVRFIHEFNNAYRNTLTEKTKVTEKGIFKPTSLGVSFLSSHPYFRQIIKRQHNKVFNIGNLMKEGALLKAIGSSRVIPSSDVAQVTDPKTMETESGIIINWTKGTPEEQNAYAQIMNELDKNRGFEGDEEALLIAMSSYVGTKLINGKRVPDLSVPKFYASMLDKGFTMTQMRQYDPNQKTDNDGLITYNHSLTEEITRTANETFSSPLPFIMALSVTAKANDTGLLGISPSEYAEQQGVKLDALYKQNFDANDLINDADAALRTLTNDDLEELRELNLRNGILLQNNGVFIESDPDQSSELFGAPLSTYGTIFSTLGDQVSAAIKTGKNMAGIEDSTIGGAIIAQYDKLDGKNRRWSSYQDDVNPKTKRTFLEEEAARRGMDVNSFLKAEERARQQNMKDLAAAQATLNDPNAKQDSIVAARRQFFAFTMAYKLASLLQGGTGGRTISDQDVQNMFRVLSQDSLTDSRKYGESMLNIKRMAKNALEVNQMVQIGLGIGSNGETPNRPLFVAAQHYKAFHAGTFTPTYNNVVNFIRYGNPTEKGFNSEQNAVDASGINKTQQFMKRRIYPDNVPSKAVDKLFNEPTEQMLQFYIQKYGEDKVPKGFTVINPPTPEEQINQAAGMSL
tara:strand:+ start:26146 stop:29232 length:3087 start_codon:yes stop_codon:yes gene_type:complete